MSRFPSTNWPLIASTRTPASPSGGDPLAELCALYWPPVYAYLRQRGHRADDAEDLTQGFFAHLLAKRVLERADPDRGRLRSLLLACLTHFVANEQHHLRARKRGGAAAPVARPTAHLDRILEPVDSMTPEHLYERQWATTLLGRVLDGLRSEFARDGKAATFDGLRLYLVGDAADGGYRRAASALKITEGAARVAVHRLRRRYRELLVREIALTVPAADVDDEIRYLRSVMQRRPRELAS